MANESPTPSAAAQERAQMEEALRQGGSVLYSRNGQRRIITNPAELPTEAELAQNDPTQTAAVRAALDAHIAVLQRQRDSLVDAPAPKTDGGNEPKKEGK